MLNPSTLWVVWYEFQILFQIFNLVISAAQYVQLLTSRLILNFFDQARELLRQTDVRNAVYVEGMQGWFDTEEREVVGIRTFDLLNRGVGIFGLAGLDLLVSFMIVRDLQVFFLFVLFLIFLRILYNLFCDCYFRFLAQ